MKTLITLALTFHLVILQTLSVARAEEQAPLGPVSEIAIENFLEALDTNENILKSPHRTPEQIKNAHARFTEARSELIAEFLARQEGYIHPWQLPTVNRLAFSVFAALSVGLVGTGVFVDDGMLVGTGLATGFVLTPLYWIRSAKENKLEEKATANSPLLSQVPVNLGKTQSDFIALTEKLKARGYVVPKNPTFNWFIRQFRPMHLNLELAITALREKVQAFKEFGEQEALNFKEELNYVESRYRILYDGDLKDKQWLIEEIEKRSKAFDNKMKLSAIPGVLELLEALKIREALREMRLALREKTNHLFTLRRKNGELVDIQNAENLYSQELALRAKALKAPVGFELTLEQSPSPGSSSKTLYTLSVHEKRQKTRIASGYRDPETELTRVAHVELDTSDEAEALTRPEMVVALRHLLGEAVTPNLTQAERENVQSVKAAASEKQRKLLCKAAASDAKVSFTAAQAIGDTDSDEAVSDLVAEVKKRYLTSQ